MVEVHDLSKYYGTKLALDRISFKVNGGEVLGFLGPNGAGKSTTMKIITGFLSPTEGNVLIDGLDIVEKSLEARKRIGYLPEHPPLYLDMTVKNYLEFAGKIRGVDRKHLRSSVTTVVEKCGLTKYYNNPCKSLSKGYRQRVGIAQAMIHEPAVLILDEPTIGLDPIQIIEIRELIKSFGGEHTVILSTHILPEVEMTCDRVVIINDGRVITQDSTANLRTSMDGGNHIGVAVRGDSAALGGKLRTIAGVEGVTEEHMNNQTLYRVKISDTGDTRPAIARAVIEENLELLEMKSMAMTLEEIFIKVTMS